jgi:hypothetical protein
VEQNEDSDFESLEDVILQSTDVALDDVRSFIVSFLDIISWMHSRHQGHGSLNPLSLFIHRNSKRVPITVCHVVAASWLMSID